MIIKQFPFDKRYSIREDGVIFGLKKIIKTHLHPTGYLYARIGKTYKHHRIVAITFLDNPNNYQDVNHINGIKTDNRVQNLEWCNDSLNIKHAFKTGLKSHCGSKNPRSKISETDIAVIKNRFINGDTNKLIALDYGVNHRSISAIRVGKNWKNV